MCFLLPIISKATRWDIEKDIKARGLPPRILRARGAGVSIDIRQNPPFAIPKDIGPRIKGLTDERKSIFALSVEYVSGWLA